MEHKKLSLGKKLAQYYNSEALNLKNFILNMLLIKKKPSKTTTQSSIDDSEVQIHIGWKGYPYNSSTNVSTIETILTNPLSGQISSLMAVFIHVK